MTLKSTLSFLETWSAWPLDTLWLPIPDNVHL